MVAGRHQIIVWMVRRTGDSISMYRRERKRAAVPFSARVNFRHHSATWSHTRLSYSGLASLPLHTSRAYRHSGGRLRVNVYRVALVFACYPARPLGYTNNGYQLARLRVAHKAVDGDNVRVSGRCSRGVPFQLRPRHNLLAGGVIVREQRRVRRAPDECGRGGRRCSSGLQREGGEEVR